MNVVFVFWFGEFWFDILGVLINVYGGGVFWYEGVYYWFGEYKIVGEVGN